MRSPVTTVVFDYGGVLSLPADPDCLERLAGWCGMPLEQFVVEQDRERLAYDRADVDPEAYWSRILALAGRKADPVLVDRLNREDLRSWSRINGRVLAWSRKLREGGVRTAILSNIPQPLLDLMRADPSFAWLGEFDVKIFSCEHRLVKPEAGIFELLLSRMGEPAASCVFLDDAVRNVEGARMAGIQAFHFRSADEIAAVLVDFALPPL
jgi:putative hydrolase of the HAD superfamily